MQIYRFWECRRENICGTEAYFKAGSNESPEHAAQLLKDKIDIFRRFNDPGVPDPPPKEVAELRCRLAGNKDYSVPICEEFVEQIDARNIVTRNRSGALVLIIHQNDLQIRISLIDDGLHAAIQIRLHLVYRHDHADQIHVAYLPASPVRNRWPCVRQHPRQGL